MTPRSASRKYSLARRQPRFDPRPRVLILCEGEKTEPTYFSHWKISLRSRLIHIEVDPTGAVPKTVVEKAIARKEQSVADAVSRRDDNLKYDEVWCVFDVDEHPNVPEALQQAQDNGIGVALSNPCFELWLLLHFENQYAHIERASARITCAKHLPGYNKAITERMFEALAVGYQKALERMNALQKQHQRALRRSNHNPSSTVGVLTERLRTLGEQAKLR